MNPAIERIREVTRGTEYEGRLFLVGGIVRDRIMGRPPTEDVDIVLEGNALEFARFLHRKGIAEHRPVTYPRFGTAMVTIEGRTIELVSARRESYAPESRKPRVEPASLMDDVMRRDFTINTLLENLHTGEVLDLTGRGRADIEAGIIRTPTEPQTTFYDDPLRMLRAVRFAVRFGFEIEPVTYEAIVRDAERLKIISKERIRDEFAKIMLSDDPDKGLRMLSDTGLLRQFAPELLEMQGVDQTGPHVWDVWNHTLEALNSLPKQADLVLRLAVLFHDTGKPRTKTIDPDGDVHFYGHEDLSAEIARRVLNRLRFPAHEINRVVRLVSMHMRIGEYREEWKDAAVKRLMRDAGADMPDLLALAYADRYGSNPHPSLEGLNDLQERIEDILLKVKVEELESPLGGREIMDLLGLAPGPKVAEVKDFLCDEVIEGRLEPHDTDTARRLVIERFGGR
mgnify:CR=1 FL=1